MSKSFMDKIRGQSLEEVLYQCRETYEDIHFPTVKEWRANGGKVLGHFQVFFPAEIAHAAGMLPLNLHGANVQPDQADSRFGSYLCSTIKTTLEIALSKQVVLDAFITHPICDAARNLGAIFGRNFDYPCEILYLPQNPNSASSIEYLAGEYDRLKRLVEKVSGKEVTDDALRHSIGIFNRNRELLRDLYDIKRECPEKIAAEDAYALMAMAGRMPREDHNEMMEYALPLIRAVDAKREDRIRVVYEGAFCEQPPFDMVRMLGRSAYVVDDDFLIGLRWILSDIPQGESPLTAMARAYIEDSSYSPVQHDLRKRKEDMLIARIRKAGGEAAIVTSAKMCEPGLEEQVAYIHGLEKANIPFFVSEFEENQTSFSGLELQLETFMENLLFV
ncbi:MAG: 2-hydroxyacyl-CoA dehydratase [Planctomycetota bacterium]